MKILSFAEILKEWMLNDLDPYIKIRFGNTNMLINRIPRSEVMDCLKRLSKNDSKFNTSNYNFEDETTGKVYNFIEMKKMIQKAS